MLRRFKGVFYKVRSDGLLSTIRWIFITIIHRIPHYQVIWQVDLEEIDTNGTNLPGNTKIKRCNSRDQIDGENLRTILDHGTELMGSAADGLINKRFEKGADLWLIEEDGLLAGYKWTIVKDSLMPTYLPHTEKDVHEMGTEIFKSYRGREILQLSTKYILIILKNEGYKKYYSETYLWNTRALKAFSKTDYRKIGIAKRFSFFGRNIVIWNDMVNKA